MKSHDSSQRLANEKGCEMFIFGKYIVSFRRSTVYTRYYIHRRVCVCVYLYETNKANNLRPK